MNETGRIYYYLQCFPNELLHIDLDLFCFVHGRNQPINRVLRNVILYKEEFIRSSEKVQGLIFAISNVIYEKKNQLSKMLESVDTEVMWKLSHASQENPRLLKRIGQLFYRTLMENRIWSSYFLLLTPNA